ncbi:MAG TPA: hypothetical protein VH092_31910, partial [Urbifossiella sp.]|nr:hypothetical protein [Urbifossiella sp.]
MDQDLSDLLATWLGGEVPEDRQAAALARLRDDPAFRATAARELHLLGMLKALRSAPPRWLRLEDELGWSAAERTAPRDLAAAVAAEVGRLPAPPADDYADPDRPTRRASRRWWALAATVLLAAGGVVAWVGTRSVPLPAAPEEAVALLVRLNRPEWAGGSGPAEGAIVRPGGFSLLGGTATLVLFSGVTVHIEGPADVELQARNRVFCRRGRLRVIAPADSSGFSAFAPGASVTDPTAEFALTVAADGSDVMVFDGQAEVSLLDASGRSVRSETLTVGKAARLDPRAGQISAGGTAPGGFAGPVPRLDPRLALAPEYPTAVRGARPAGYWRFESAAAGLVPNEVRAGPALRLVGQAALTDPGGGNRTLTLPPSTEWEQHGAVAEGAWAPAGREYAIECWAMPRLVRQ